MLRPKIAEHINYVLYNFNFRAILFDCFMKLTAFFSSMQTGRGIMKNKMLVVAKINLLS